MAQNGLWVRLFFRMTKPILSVITSYYSARKFVKARYDNFIKTINDPRIEFICYEWTKKNKVFSTAFCHNMAVMDAIGEWILKMDIDCSCDLIMFEKIIKLVEGKPDNFFANFGCKGYLGDIGYPQGNQYLCRNETYFLIGGEPEFEGYYGEDYALLYALAKYQDINFKLDYNNPEELCITIRDKIARPLNKKYQDIYFNHQAHEKSPFRKGFVEINKKKLFDYCRELDKIHT